MARLDSWDVCAFQPTWFDVNFSPAGTGWWDRDLVPPPVVPPPPPKPKPKPLPPTRGSGGGGGGSGVGGLAPYNPPEWLKPWLLQFYSETEVEAEEVETDFALLHVTPGTPIRALAVGVIESFVDIKGRTSVALVADDGTKYWYAEIGTRIVADGVRVKVGEVIAHTESGTLAAPAITPKELLPPTTTVAEMPLLPAAPPPEPSAPKPVQIVFVQAPEPAPPPLPPLPPLPPQPPLTRYILVPVRPPEAPHPPEKTPSVWESPVLRVAAVAGFFVILLAIASAQPPPPPRRKRRRRRRR